MRDDRDVQESIHAVFERVTESVRDDDKRLPRTGARRRRLVVGRNLKTAVSLTRDRPGPEPASRRARYPSIVLVDSPTELGDSTSCDMGPYLSPESQRRLVAAIVGCRPRRRS